MQSTLALGPATCRYLLKVGPIGDREDPEVFTSVSETNTYILISALYEKNGE